MRSPARNYIFMVLYITVVLNETWEIYCIHTLNFLIRNEAGQNYGLIHCFMRAENTF